jgi:membrane protein DedA with SNARE-associated domain
MHHAISPTGMADWLANWGYLGLFVCVFVGNLGIPMPEETVLLAAGFLAGRNILDLKTVYVVGIASAVSGDCSGYLFGRTSGTRLLAWVGRTFPYLRPGQQRLEAFFQTHGSKAVFMARFITGARFMAGPMAGAAGMSFWRFLGWNVLGALIWCSLVSTIGYLVGDELEWVAKQAHRAFLWIGLGIVLLLGAAWFLRRRDRQPSEAGPPTLPKLP